MTRRHPPRGRSLLLSLALLAAASCSTSHKATRPYKEPPPPNIDPKPIIYVEADAFDAQLESMLVSQEPAILIVTGFKKPEWGPRLNAWIAAWNAGGRVAADDKRRVRGQAPLSPVVVNEGSLKEFRLLIGGLMNRVDDLARNGSAWWAEEKVKSRRVALLKPYNLRFHLDGEDNIQIILFNGMYSQYHKDFVTTTAEPDADVCCDWHRDWTCSRCKNAHLHEGATEEAEPPPFTPRAHSGRE